ncbi:MAG: sigma-70 family RNA polymerase sigma factor [Streptosporangiaceae bacterium]
MHDGEVGAAIAVGDPGGLAEAYDRYAPALYSYCRSLVPEPGDAAEAVQDTFVIAAAELAGLHDPHRLRPWLYAVARNECLRRVGGSAAFAVPAQAVPVDDGPVDEVPVGTVPAGAVPVGGVPVGGVPFGGVPAGGVPAGGVPAGGVPVGAVTGDGFGAAERAELGALLRAAAWGLGAGERDLIQLRWQQGLDVAEIAAILGVSRNRAHALLSSAQDQLRTALAALLVARTGGDDCDTLGALLKDGDGQLTVTMRKRIDRHIRRCRVCACRSRRELGPRMMLGFTPLAAPTVAAMPDGLRARVLRLANSGTPGAVAYRAGVTARTAPFRRAGFPKPIDPPGRQWWPSRQRQASVAAGVAIAGTVAAATLLTLAMTSGGSGRHDGAAGATLAGRPAPVAGTGGKTIASVGSGGPGSARPTRSGHASPAVTVTVTVGGLPPAAGSASGSAPRGSRPSATGSASRRSSPAPSARSSTARASSSATPRPVQGTLTVLPTSIAPLPGRSVTLTVTASNGPVSWSITLSQALIGELTVVPSSGTLAAGASATVTVTPTDLLIAGGQLTLEPGGIIVTVTPYL